MDTIEDIIEQEIAEPLVEEQTHHTHHHIQSHRTHRHHHNGSIVMVNTQLMHRGGHEMNNNGAIVQMKS